MKKNTDKNITIDQLAVMVQRGFEETKRELHKEISDLEHRINLKFDAVEHKFGIVERRFNDMDKRFDEVEGKIEAYTSFWHRKFSEHEV